MGIALLTLDVEDWEHANFAQLASPHSSQVSVRSYNMEKNTDLWIDLCRKANATSTCFVLGEFAVRYPEAVKRLHQAGHEIACHGMTHDLVTHMTKEDFREGLNRSLGILTSLTGQKVEGYRAASWSVSRVKTPWFCEELLAQGIRYDSSEFPVKTPLFGDGAAPLEPHYEGTLFRIPVTVLTIFGARLPFSSGAFFRLAPLPLIRAGFKRASAQELPQMIVLHPRELDPDHPRLPLKGWEGYVHYVNLKSVKTKLNALLQDQKWTSIKKAYKL